MLAYLVPAEYGHMDLGTHPTRFATKPSCETVVSRDSIWAFTQDKEGVYSSLVLSNSQL